jgi:hypothetical protein
MNGGGFVGGTLEQDESNDIAFARELGITVVAVRPAARRVHVLSIARRSRSS